MKPKSNLFAAVLPLVAISVTSISAAPLYWKTSAANSWSGAFWGANPGGPYTSAWTPGADVIFEDNGGTALTITGATTNFASITANENVTVTASGTVATGGTVATIDVASGKTLNFAGQALSTATGTGFIKNGLGTWSLANGNAYAGGFTLNAGTVAVGGVNAMGSGGALVINGGTIRSTDTNSRDLSGKFASVTAPITLGGDVTLGDSVNYGLLTFNSGTSLGAATRTLTVNSAVTHNGVISGSGVGLIKAGSGVLTLGGTNTYSGPTTISAGVLSLTNSAALPGGLTTSGTYSVASGAGLAVPNTVTDATIASMLGTTNFAAGAAIGFDTTAGGRSYPLTTGSIGDTAQGGLGLVKTGGNTLTLSAANTYSGGTTVYRTADNVGIAATNANAFGTGPVVITSTTGGFNGNISVGNGLNIGNALTLKTNAANRTIAMLSANSTWSGNISIDNSAGTGGGFPAISIDGTAGSGAKANSIAAAALVSGNITQTAAGTNTIGLVLRGGAEFGKITGSVSMATATVQLVDNTSWEFSNGSNTWGKLDINNDSAFAYVGASNTLSSTGVVSSNSTNGGTLRLNNMVTSGMTAFDQTIAGLSGNVKVGLQTGTTGTATLTLNTTADQSSSGVISGAINLVKSGSAKQTLTGTNTYTGTTTINGGTLALGTTGVIPTNDLTISSATLDLRKGTAVRTQVVNNLTLSNATVNIGLNAAPDQINALGASVSGTNTLKIYGSTPVGVYNLIATQAPLSGTFVLDTSGVTPSGFPVSYSGAINGNNYELTVSGAATPTTAYWRGDVSSVWNDSSAAPNSNWAQDSSGSSDTGQIPGAITDVYFSAGNATNTNTTLGGNISINSLIFESGSATVGGTHTLTILQSIGSGIDVLSGATGTIATGGLACTSTCAVEAGGTLTVNSGGLGSGTLLVDGTLNLNMNVAHEFLIGAASGSISRGIAGTSTLTISNSNPANNSTYDGAINNGAGSIALTKGGASTLTLGGNSNFSGGTTISGGIIKANASNALGSGTVAINGGVRLSLGEGATLANAITLGANAGEQGAALVSASTAVTGSASVTGPVTITASPFGGGHFNNLGTGTFDVKGAITSSVPVIHRNGTVAYWGGGTGYTSMLVTGTARIGANNGLATTATVTLGNSGAATLDLAGMNQSLVGIVKFNATNAATVGNSSTTADSVLTTTGTGTFDGVITNAVGAGTRKTGLAIASGTLTLGGVNTYTGDTSIASGAGFALSDNAQLRFATGAASATSNGITGAGIATINGDFNIDTSVTDASALTSGTWTLENVPSVYGSTFQVLSGATAWTATGDVWTKTVGTKTYSFDEATGVLTLTSTGGGFDTWASSKGLSGADAAFTADPDHDGLNNGLEFVLGGEPNPANPGSNSASLLPTISQSAGNMVFSFKRKDVSESGVALTFQWSTDLTFPSPSHDVAVGAVDSVTDTINVDVTEDSPDADTDSIVITIPAAKAAGGKLFGRLSAVKTP